MYDSDQTKLVVHIPDEDGFGEKPGFDANLPSDVRYDPKLSPITKLIYAEVRALSSKYGFCFAKNEYFERVYEIDKRTLQRALKQLSENHYIYIFKARNDVNGKIYRIIKIAGSKIVFEEGQETTEEKNATKMSQKERQKCREKRDKNVTHVLNNNNINNINLNKINDSTKKSKNKFQNFEQREYPTGFFDALVNYQVGLTDKPPSIRAGDG